MKGCNSAADIIDSHLTIFNPNRFLGAFTAQETSNWNIDWIQGLPSAGKEIIGDIFYLCS
jgi:hypothetical protein